MIQRYVTPDGFDNLLLTFDGDALTDLRFEGSRKQNSYVETRHGTSLHKNSILKDTCHWLDIYFSGRQPDFTPPYRMDGLTPFRKEVLEMVKMIPFGQVLTYGEIAEAVACNRGVSKMSAQAVGGAVGWNPICLIVPCHRVIGVNGKLTGYGGGMNNKVALLKMEGFLNAELEADTVK